MTCEAMCMQAGRLNMHVAETSEGTRPTHAAMNCCRRRRPLEGVTDALLACLYRDVVLN